jgi:uncharacterized membrane protein
MGFETLHHLVESERALADRLLRRQPPSNPNETLNASLTLGERLADRVAEVAGSWGFIGIFSAALAGWIALNLHGGGRAFDPFPFILLNLVLSTVAALQAPVIMMSQNRQAARDRAQADLDFRINVQAEAEIAQLKAEMDELRRQQWVALLAMQQEQLSLLRQLAEGAGDRARSA